MNVNATSSQDSTYIPPSLPVQGSLGATVSGASDLGRGGNGGHGGGHVHKGHRGGVMGQALMHALQSMGLSVPQQGASPNTQSSSGAQSGTDRDGDHDGTGAADGGKGDLRSFMHALFQAVKAEKTSSNTTPSTTTAGSKADFAGSLSALISQVSNGSAPSNLQAAFDKLATDLQPAVATGSTTGGAGSASAVTLQKLLDKLQQNLGYGASSNTFSAGSLVSEKV